MDYGHKDGKPIFAVEPGLKEQDHLLLLQANEEIRNSLYALAHDIREPLRAIGTSIELMLQNNQNRGDESARLTEIILDGLDRLNRLIRDVLDHANLSDPKASIEEVNTRDVVALALQTFKKPIEDTGATVHLGFLPRVEANDGQLLRLFENLIGNAIKYRGEKRPEIDISASRGDREWTFCVRDNGIGIAANHHTRIFEMFTRLHATCDGSGLGLATCKKIVQNLNGRIWVESRVGEGSEFYFTVPAKSHVPAKPPAMEASSTRTPDDRATRPTARSARGAAAGVELRMHSHR